MFQYITTFVPNKVLIIGGGGTGSRLVPLLAQFFKTAAWILNPEITVVDDDVVEEKNLLRQNFISVDVGKPKAEVLAQRYSRAFNIPIVPVVKRIKPALGRYAYVETAEQIQASDDDRQIKELFARYVNNSIIVMCVDSPEARRHILGHILYAQSYTMSNGNIFLIDSGNENDFGQINVSTAKVADLGSSRYYVEDWKGKMMGDKTIPLIPMDLAYFRDMKAENTLSCADLDQTMAINTMMAVTMFGIIQNLIYAKPISFHRLNVSLAHGITPEYMNPQFLLRVADRSGYIRAPFTEQTCEVTTFAVNIAKDITAFESEVAFPARAALETAERKAKEVENAKKLKEEQAIRDKAVKQAMALYGWKKPEEKSEEKPAEASAALSGTASRAVKKAATDLTEKAQSAFEATVAKSAVKRVMRKKYEPATDTEALIREISETFGITSGTDEPL